MKGIMRIKDCNFMNNEHYKDHGSVIKYTSVVYAPFHEEYPLEISNCTFNYIYYPVKPCIKEFSTVIYLISLTTVLITTYQS